MDDRGRELERAARSGDRDATFAWLHALERSGDHLGAWRVRCRQARAGDAEARRQLAPKCLGVRSATTVRRVELSPCHFAHVADEVACFASERDLVALDARSLEPVWRASCAGRSAARAGPLVLHADAAGLRMRLAANGRDLGRIAIAIPEGRRMTSMSACADLLLVSVTTIEEEAFKSSVRSIVFDLSADPPELVPPPEGAFPWAQAICGSDVVWRFGREWGRDLVVAPAHASRPPLRITGTDAVADEQTIVVGWGAPGPELEPRGRAVLDARTADTLWTWSDPDWCASSTVALDGDDIVIGSYFYPHVAIELRDRTRGDLRWRAELRFFGGIDVVFTDHVVFVANCVAVGSGKQQHPAGITAFERTTGRELWSRAFEHAGLCDVVPVAHEAAVLVLAHHNGGTTIERVEEH